MWGIKWGTKWDIHRYKRCAQVLLPAVGAKAVFLRLYALYLAGTYRCVMHHAARIMRHANALSHFREPQMRAIRPCAAVARRSYQRG